MATSGVVITTLSEATGRRPATVDRMLRPLREAGLVPMGAPGRGQRFGHYEAQHLANALLGLSGAEPSDAAEAVNLLASLPRGATDKTSAEVILFSEKVTLGERIEEIIRKRAEDGTFPLPQLTMSVAPLHAKIQWTYNNKIFQEMYQTSFFGPKDSDKFGAQTWTVLLGQVFAAAAALYSDTLNRQAEFVGLMHPSADGGFRNPISENETFRDLPEGDRPFKKIPDEDGSFRNLPVKDINQGALKPRSKTASPLPGGEAALRAQTRKTDMDRPQQPDPTASEAKPQSRSGMRGASPSKSPPERKK